GRALCLALVRLAPGAAATHGSGASHPGNARLVAGVVEPLHLPGPLARASAPLAHYAEGTHVRSHGGYPGGVNDFAARTVRRRAQLGLSLLLAPRRHVHALR